MDVYVSEMEMCTFKQKMVHKEIAKLSKMYSKRFFCMSQKRAENLANVIIAL